MQIRLEHVLTMLGFLISFAFFAREQQQHAVRTSEIQSANMSALRKECLTEVRTLRDYIDSRYAPISAIDGVVRRLERLEENLTREIRRKSGD